MDIKIENVDAKQFEDEVTIKVSRLIADDIFNHVENTITEKVVEAVQLKAAEVAQRQLEPMVSKVLAEGFQQTDMYGARSGKLVTLPEFIRNQLTVRRNGRSWLDDKVAARTDEIWKAEMAGQLKWAKEEVRKRVDERLGAELAKAAREAAGIR